MIYILFFKRKKTNLWKIGHTDCNPSKPHECVWLQDIKPSYHIYTLKSLGGVASTADGITTMSSVCPPEATILHINYSFVVFTDRWDPTVIETHAMRASLSAAARGSAPHQHANGKYGAMLTQLTSTDDECTVLHMKAKIIHHFFVFYNCKHQSDHSWHVQASMVYLPVS